MAAEQEGEASPPKAVKNWRRLKQIPIGVFLCSVAAEIRLALQDQVEFRRQELRALEVTWAEIAAQFDGEDPRHPELRDKAAAVSERLRLLAERVALRPRQVPEPTEEMLSQMREQVERAFGHFNLRVTRP